MHRWRACTAARPPAARRVGRAAVAAILTTMLMLLLLLLAVLTARSSGTSPLASRGSSGGTPSSGGSNPSSPGTDCGLPAEVPHSRRFPGDSVVILPSVRSRRRAPPPDRARAGVSYGTCRRRLDARAAGRPPARGWLPGCMVVGAWCWWYRTSLRDVLVRWVCKESAKKQWSHLEMIRNSKRDSEFPARKSPIHCKRRVDITDHGRP